MNPKLRLWLFVIAGAALGTCVGVQIANESYGWATVLALVACWIMVERMSEAPPDAWLLAAALVGYIVGNRGFAQVQPAAQIPLLPAEGVLLVAFPTLVVRMAMKKTAGFRKDLLNCSILVWMIIGCARLPLDMSRYGVIALRDFAMIYYATFFFIAQALGSSAASSRLLMRALTIAFIGLLGAVVSIEISPDFLVDHFTWRGIPIIYHKSDLIATSLAAGFFWLWTRQDKARNRLWILPAGASLLLIGAMASPRAAMAAVAMTTFLWLLVGRWRIAVWQLGMVLVGSVLALVALEFMGKDLRTSAPYSAYEHAVSIFDPTGSGSYINGESGDPGDNNRFRLIWWHSVFDETIETNPVFGLGFGSDLASRFLADYDLLSDENFSARSPHSMIMTVFGRMGILGFLAWIVASAAMGQMAWRLIKRGDPDDVGLACIVTVTWVSACVGVVLEGPMGAVVFWTALGLANSRLKGPAPAAKAADTGTKEERPVAKLTELATQSFPR
jgi:O-antigen ligase/polysaccharide polymerase Wzy-like membrane protein